MIRLIFISLMVILSISIKAQECDCSDSFEWMVKTIENNDAGFQDIIKREGAENYNSFVNNLRKQVRNIKTTNECHVIMLKYLRYFRKAHLYLQNNNPVKIKQDEKSIKEIRERFSSAITLNLTESQLIDRIDKKENLNPIEGIWAAGNYKIGIINNDISDSSFTAFVLKADSIYWLPKQVKMKITQNADRITYSANYYMKNHDTINVHIKFLLNSYSIFQLYNSKNTFKNFYWYREYPKPEFTDKEKLYKSLIISKKPFIEILSDKTIYLRIPSFRYSQKVLIDSILNENKQLIDTMPNLIIDIRNGTGGSDFTWENLIPILYTNPMFLSGIEFRATELNAQGYENYTKGKVDSTFINHCIDISKSMREHLGEFFNYYSKNDYSIKVMDTTYLYPKRVAIVVNQRNASADEQFLYLAKQSRKVKIYGTPTMGCYDVSNLNKVTSPDGNFTLWYAMSKSCRLPDYPLDDIGIQPDIYLNRDISDIDWIEYVKMVLE